MGDSINIFALRNLAVLCYDSLDTEKSDHKAYTKTGEHMDADLLERFDYILLDAHTRQLVQKRTIEIKGLVKHLAKDTIWIGKNLIEVNTTWNVIDGNGAIV